MILFFVEFVSFSIPLFFRFLFCYKKIRKGYIYGFLRRKDFYEKELPLFIVFVVDGCKYFKS